MLLMNHVLTDKAVKSAKPGVDGQAVRLWDGGGLYLQVGKTGSRLWRYKYRLGGKENVFALGAYPEVSLAQARDRHKEARELVEKGVAPRSQREIEKVKAIAVAADTFKATAEEWIAKKKATWTPTYLRQVEAFLKSDVYPAFGALPISQVTAAHILAVMKSAESRGAETIAILIRQWCSQIFRYAVSNLRAESDPAAALRGAVIRPKVKHNKSLSKQELAGVLAKLQVFSGERLTAIAMELLMLTFVRTVELRCADWAEFDLKAKLWTVPAARMKMKTAHIVPLSKQVIALLAELSELTGGKGWLFPNNRRAKACMSATTINRALERMGLAGKASDLGFSAHGFRARHRPCCTNWTSGLNGSSCSWLTRPGTKWLRSTTRLST
jgi:integrase